MKVEGSVPVVSPPAPTSADRPPSAAAAAITAPPSAETDLRAQPLHPDKHTNICMCYPLDGFETDFTFRNHHAAFSLFLPPSQDSTCDPERPSDGSSCRGGQVPSLRPGEGTSRAREASHVDPSALPSITQQRKSNEHFLTFQYTTNTTIVPDNDCAGQCAEDLGKTPRWIWDSGNLVDWAVTTHKTRCYTSIRVDRFVG